MSSSNAQQLILDWVDGQLTPDQIAHAQQLIAEDNELAALYESLMEQQAALKQIPDYKLDDSFADRIVQLASDKGLVSAPSETKPKSSPALPTGKPNWWTPVAAIASLAALILVTLFVVPNMVLDQWNVAENTPANPSLEVPAGPESDSDKENEEADGAMEPAKGAFGGVADTTVEKGTNLKASGDESEMQVIQSDALQAMDDESPKTMEKSFSLQPRKLDNGRAESNPMRIQSGGGFGGGGVGGGGASGGNRTEKSELANRPPTPTQTNDAPADQMIESVSETKNKSLPQIAGLRNADPSSVTPKPEMAQALRGATSQMMPQANNQVLVFKIDDNPETLQFINETLAENGIEIDLPLTQTQSTESDAQEESAGGANSDEGNFAANQVNPKREFAYAVRSKLEQMNKAVVKLSDQAEILAVNSTPAYSQMRMQRAKNGPESNQAPYRQGMQDSVRSGRNQLDTKKIDRRRDTAQRGQPGVESADSNQNATNAENSDAVAQNTASIDQGLRDINQFFGLSPDQEASDEELGYTLIFMLQDSQPAIPAPATNSIQDASGGDK